MSTKARLRAERNFIRREIQDAANYRDHLYWRISRLDGSDPEDRDAARDWASSARWQDQRIRDLERVLWRLDTEIDELRSAS